MDSSRIRITGPLAPYLEDLWSDLLAQGYTPLSSANLARLMADLSRWLERKRLTPEQLNADQIEGFVRHRKRAGYTCWLSKRGLEPVLACLRRLGIVPQSEATQVIEGPFDKLLRPYEEYLHHERGVTQTTTDRYAHLARDFLRGHFGSRAIDLGSLTATHVCDFVLRESRTASVGTTKYKVTALRSFLRYLYVRGELAVDLAASVPMAAGWRLTSLPKALTADQVSRLLRSCDRRTHVGRRNYAAMLMMVRLGLRAGEVAALELSDIHWTRAEIVIHGKGGQADRLPLPHDVGTALASYLRRSRPRIRSRKAFLRVMAPQGALGTSGVKAIVYEAGRRVGLAPLGTHRLRHTAATAMLRGGASLSEIAQVLRHRHLDTTAIYAKVHRSSLRTLAQPWPGGAA